MIAFTDEEQARHIFEHMRWGAKGLPVCPFCNAAKFWVVNSSSPRPQMYKCASCHKFFTVRTGTILENTKLPLGKWLYLLYRVVLSPLNIPVLRLQSEMEIAQYKTLHTIVGILQGKKSHLVEAPVNKLLKNQLRLVITTLELIIAQLPDEEGDDSDIPRPGDKEKFGNRPKAAVSQNRKEKTLRQPKTENPVQSDLLTPLQPHISVFWSEQEINAVVENVRNLRPLNTGLPRRTVDSCKSILKRNKISLQSIYAKIPNLPPPTGRGGARIAWTLEEDRKLFNNWRKGLELEDGLSGRNRKACKIRFDRLEQRYPDGKIPETPPAREPRLYVHSKTWTPDEEKILKHNYQHRLSLNRNLPSRTVRACQQRYYSTVKPKSETTKE